jgi:hypothetical protein
MTMCQYYFDVRSNGRLWADRNGRELNGWEQARDAALKETARRLGVGMAPGRTNVTVEVLDDEARMVLVVNAEIHVELEVRPSPG